jgi:hypothetical protein
MRRTLRILIVVLAVGALSFTGGIAVAGAMSSTAAAQADDATHLQLAVDALKSAEKHLDEVKGKAGGHLAPALKATQDAIKHADEGLKALKK